MIGIILRAAPFLGALVVCCVSLGIVATAPTSASQIALACSDEDTCCKKPLGAFTVAVNGEERAIPYAVIDGRAVVEGDIDIGPADQIPSGRAAYSYYGAPIRSDVQGQPKRWPHNTVDYAIDPKLNAHQRGQIRGALAEWKSKTAIVFHEVGWTTNNWRTHNYVKFTDVKTDGSCWSNSIGMKSKEGGSQEEDNINIVNVRSCRDGQTGAPGGVIHEIGHVLGLYHEQSRHDRDEYVEVMWSNIVDGDAIKKELDNNRKQYCRALYEDLALPGTYDYRSIMHYKVNDFARLNCQAPPDGQCLTLAPKKARLSEQGIVSLNEVGQREGLSKGDIALINMMYPPPREPPVPGGGPLCNTTTTTTTTSRHGTTITTTTTTQRCPGGKRPPPPVVKPPGQWPHCCCCAQVHFPRPHRVVFPPPPPVSHLRWWGPSLWERGDFDEWDD